MNIAFLIDKYGGKSIGGGEVHLKLLKQHLEKQYKCRCTIYGQPHNSILARFLWDIWVIPVVIFNHFFKPIDLIHSHGFSSGPAAWILGKILRKPIIHTVHGSHLMDLKDKSLKCLLEKVFLTKIPYDVEITVSQSFTKYQTKAKLLKVITNGVVLPGIPNLITEPEQAPVPRSKSKPIIFLTVSRLETQKGLDILIEALASIKSQLPKFKLRIIGNGSQYHPLKAQVKRLQMESYVSMPGKKTGKHLNEEYQKADLFILPSLAEGQPIVLLEAWSHKLPVIVTDVGHNRYMVKSGETGWIVKPNSAEELGETILKAVKRQTSWPKIGQAGYDEVLQNYTWDTITKQIYTIYQKLIPKNNNYVVFE